MSFILIENYIINTHKIIILDEMTLPELRDQDKYLSDFTKGTKEERKKIQNTANINSKFLETKIDEDEGSVTFKFLTEATELLQGNKKMNKDEQKYQIDPNTKEKQKNPSHTYEIWIKVLNVLPTKENEGWIEAYDIENEPVSNPQLKEIMNVADIQIFSNDPSFLFQGFQYNLTVKDASIFPENRKPKRWNKIHGETALLTKHIAQLFTSMDFFLPQMASSLNDKLQQLGYLPKKRKHTKK